MVSRRPIIRFFVVLLATTAPAAYCQAATPPENVTVVTRDGVQLHLTYYPSSRRKGTDEAKEITPVLLLHDHKENRSTLTSLAQRLLAVGEGKRQGPAFAVVIADLRAHGESTLQQLPTGATVTLDPVKLNKNVLAGMATYDMEAIRSFLVGKNDAGELNLNKLCIVGAGMGANVAANWSVQDWSAPPLAIGKQGQDVKALVLISPQWSYNGLTFQAPMKFAPLKRNVAWLLMYGDQDKKTKDEVERIEKQLEKFHPKQPPGSGQPGSLQIVNVQSKLQGGTLLSRIGQPMDDQIVQFLVQNVARKPFPWTNRLDRVPRD